MKHLMLELVCFHFDLHFCYIDERIQKKERKVLQKVLKLRKLRKHERIEGVYGSQNWEFTIKMMNKWEWKRVGKEVFLDLRNEHFKFFCDRMNQFHEILREMLKYFWKKWETQNIKNNCVSIQECMFTSDPDLELHVFCYNLWNVLINRQIPQVWTVVGWFVFGKWRKHNGIDFQDIMKIRIWIMRKYMDDLLNWIGWSDIFFIYGAILQFITSAFCWNRSDLR
jgi:hypothetical protein